MNKIEERMDKASADRMSTALDTVSDLLEDGNLSPEDAFVKSCSQHNIPVGHVPLMSRVFNAGRANFHRKSGSTVLEKTTPVPLVDAAAVVERLRPSFAVKSAAQRRAMVVVSDDYARDASSFLSGITKAKMPKAASTSAEAASPPPPLSTTGTVSNRPTERAIARLRDYDHMCKEAEVAVSKAYLDVRGAFKVACDLLRTGRVNNWTEVRQNFVQGHGADAEAVCRHVEAGGKAGLKKAASVIMTYAPMSATNSPYKELLACMKAARTYCMAKEAQAQLLSQNSPDKLRQKIMPMSSSPTLAKKADEEKKPGPGLLSKSFQGTGGGFLSGLGAVRSVASAPGMESYLTGADVESRDDKAMEALTSPDHEQRLMEIRSKAMLSDLLANDPVISGHEPEAVVGAFNELQRLAPRSLAEPALARALLRKHLSQGGVDAHELQQLADTEVSVRRAREPSSLTPPAARPVLGARRGYETTK